MKLEDIKSAVRHAAEAELKRSFYNACAVFTEVELHVIFVDLFYEVYKADEERTDSDA